MFIESEDSPFACARDVRGALFSKICAGVASRLLRTHPSHVRAGVASGLTVCQHRQMLLHVGLLGGFGNDGHSSQDRQHGTSWAKIGVQVGDGRNPVRAVQLVKPEEIKAESNPERDPRPGGSGHLGVKVEEADRSRCAEGTRGHARRRSSRDCSRIPPGCGHAKQEQLFLIPSS